MNKPSQSIGSFIAILICSVSLGLSGCENPGSVGSELTKSKAELKTDTIFVEGVKGIQPNSYSGELSFFSIGSFDDPLFGNMETRGFIKPGVPTGSNSLNVNAEMLLRIILNGDQTYGDNSATQEFSLYEIGEYWRDKALKIHDDIRIDTSYKVGEFSVTDEDSLDVTLASGYVDKYRDLTESDNPDSLYNYENYGLAAVPENGKKIIPLNSSSTRFVIQNPESDTFDVGMKEWGYNLNRSGNGSIPQGSVPLSSTYENVATFKDLGTSQIDVQVTAISKVELVVYENSSAMEQSLQTEPTSVFRSEAPKAFLHMGDPAYVPENIDPGNSDLRVEGTYSESDGSYRFGITQLVKQIKQNGVPEGHEFFITFPNDGILKQSIIYTDSDQVPVEKQPKVIITSLKQSNN